METDKLRLDPQQMEQKAGEFDARCTEFTDLVTTMKNMVTDLTEEWAGNSSKAFYDQFESLEPGFNDTAQLITSIAQQLREVSAAMMEIDSQIAGKINGTL